MVSAFTQIPGFGNQFDLGQYRVLVNDIEERAQSIHIVQLTGQSGGEVKPETIDVHVLHPVAQAVHDELQRARMPDVQTVSTARVVHVVTMIVRDETIVGGIVDASK